MNNPSEKIGPSAQSRAGRISSTCVTPAIRASRKRGVRDANRPQPLLRDDAAVDVVGLASDVPRPGRGQEHGHRGDVLGVVGALQRDVLGAETVHLLNRDARPFGRTRRLASDNAVRVTPGQIELTLMLCLPSCWDAVLVRPMTAPLLAA